MDRITSKRHASLSKTDLRRQGLAQFRRRPRIEADGNPEEIDEILFDVTEELANAPASDQNAEE
jgi:hypothetical protein